MPELIEMLWEDNRGVYDILKVMQSEGIEQKNYRVLFILSPRLKRRIKGIEATAQRIVASAPRKRGRPPKWLEVARDVYIVAGESLDYLERMAREMDRRRYIVVTQIIAKLADNCRMIYEDLNSLPEGFSSRAEPVPEVFRQEMDD